MDPSSNGQLWTRLRSSGGWLTRAWDVGQALRPTGSRTGELLVVGTPDFDPWHVTAHLDQQGLGGALPGLRPILLRWTPPPAGPTHLRHSVEELTAVGSRQTVLVVAPDPLDESALERLADVRRRGAKLLAVSGRQDELTGLSHEAVSVSPGCSSVPQLPGCDDFELASHLLSLGARTPPRAARRALIPWQIGRRPVR